MKQRSNQGYITIGQDGALRAPASAPEEAPAAGTPGAADVVYRLTRIAEEATIRPGSAPNAVEAADASTYYVVTPAEASLLPRSGARESAAAGPIALVMARGKTAKRLLPAVADAGMMPCAAFTQDRRGDVPAKATALSVCLGEKYSDALFANSHAVLAAAAECGAAVILLADEALPLAQVDSFLSRAAAQGLRVFKPLDAAKLELGWVLCTTDRAPQVGGKWRKCRHCGLSFDESSMAAAHYVCPSCGGYARMSSTERINDLLDANSFEEWDAQVAETDPLSFPGYPDKLAAQREKTGLEEGVRTGAGSIAGLRCAIGIMESQFFMGSMGRVVGEKVTRLVERATAEHLPVIIFTASGGARMQEGLVSLMQMAKVSCALERHAAARLPYISVITDPTTGGVTASFATQGDIIISEPHALIGFAGQRVIRDTIRQELPEGFQTAEFALEHGLIDAIVERADLRATLANLLALHVATEPRTRAGREPGDTDVLVTYDAVRENLENGTGTYNTVTYSGLVVEDAAPEEDADAPAAPLLSRLAGIAGKLDPRAQQRSRIERAVLQGAFDAEEGASLEMSSASDADELASAEAGAGPNRAWESVQLARNVHRPTSMAYIDRIVDGFVELHGDRMFADDGAIVAGLGWIGGRAVTVIAQEKGIDLKQRIKRNFGCPQPEGYRKALRLMREADRFGRPIVCLVDTQGAFCGTEAEERGQGNAIADNLIGMAGLTVPVVSVLLGEGGSGGALALAVADRVAMLEHAVYSVLSPEGFASILWKDRTRAPEAAAVMKMSAREACDMGIVDAVLSEGAGPAHENPDEAAESVRAYVEASLDDLAERTPEELVESRYNRFRRM